MDLRWPWLAVALAGAVVVLLVWWSRRPRTSSAPDTLQMAAVARLRRLPRYRRLRRRALLLGTWTTIGALLTLTGAVLLAARPQDVRTERTERARDLMLCLDASASMDPYNERVVQQVRRVLADLDGGRVGVTVFSSTAVTLVPLTADLDYVGRVLEQAERSFANGSYLFVAGTELAQDDRASLLGDGIVSCAERFDRLDEDRARSMVVTSDNDPVGQPVYTVGAAAAFAAARDVVVHAIASPATEPGPPADDFKAAVVATSGLFATLDDDGTAGDLVDRIQAQEARREQVPPRRVVTEAPRAGTAVTTAGVGVLALGWLAQATFARPRRRS